MLKKNNSEIRYNTAGARILINSRLPNDFFLFQRFHGSKRPSNWEEICLAPIERDNIKKNISLKEN
jgi:hypothetical protein